MSQFIKVTRPVGPILVNVSKVTFIGALKDAGCIIMFEHDEDVIVSESIDQIENLIRG